MGQALGELAEESTQTNGRLRLLARSTAARNQAAFDATEALRGLLRAHGIEPPGLG